METVIVIAILLAVGIGAYLLGRRIGDDGRRDIERALDALVNADSGLDDAGGAIEDVKRELDANTKRIGDSKERSKRIEELLRELAKRRSQTKD